MRQRKDHMIIRYRQEFSLPLLEPRLGVALVAFWATAIATGVIRILSQTTAIALKYMAPHGGSAAPEYVSESPSVAWQHLTAKLPQILGAVASEDFCYFDHDGSSTDQPRLMTLLIFAWTSAMVLCDRCI